MFLITQITSLVHVHRMFANIHVMKTWVLNKSAKAYVFEYCLDLVQPEE